MSVSRIISLCVLSTVSVITAPALLSAEDWFEFRGPTGQGHSSQTSLPTAWSPTEHVLWNTKIPGVGWSSPIIVGEKVFVTTAVPEGDGPMPEQSLRVICLDLESGKILWDKEIFQETKETVQRIHKKNSHASPTPISDGKVLYVHFGTHGTACLTLDGDVVWKTNALKYEMQHGNGGSPILVDDKLVVICDGKGSNFIAALDRLPVRVAASRSRNPQRLTVCLLSPLPSVREAQKRAGQQAHFPRPAREGHPVPRRRWAHCRCADAVVECAGQVRRGAVPLGPRRRVWHLGQRLEGVRGPGVCGPADPCVRAVCTVVCTPKGPE